MESLHHLEDIHHSLCLASINDGGYGTEHPTPGHCVTKYISYNTVTQNVDQQHVFIHQLAISYTKFYFLTIQDKSAKFNSCQHFRSYSSYVLILLPYFKHWSVPILCQYNVNEETYRQWFGTEKSETNSELVIRLKDLATKWTYRD